MQFTTKFISKQKLILIIGGLLITGAALYAAQWRWHFWHSANKNTPLVTSETPVIDEGLPEEGDVLPDTGGALRNVLAANLFGQEGEVKKGNGSEAAPKTQQPLELHGIFFIPNHPEQAVALIAQAGGEAKKYATGAEIESLPGWRVLEILPNSVRIGQDEPGEILPLLAVSASPFAGASPNANPANQFNSETQDNSAPEDPVAPLEENVAPEAEVVDENAAQQENMPPPTAVPPANNAPVPNNAAPMQNMGE